MTTDKEEIEKAIVFLLQRNSLDEFIKGYKRIKELSKTTDKPVFRKTFLQYGRLLYQKKITISIMDLINLFDFKKGKFDIPID